MVTKEDLKIESCLERTPGPHEEYESALLDGFDGTFEAFLLIKELMLNDSSTVEIHVDSRDDDDVFF